MRSDEHQATALMREFLKSSELTAEAREIGDRLQIPHDELAIEQRKLRAMCLRELLRFKKEKGMS